ncbi:apolipoprotein N-acyltransferase [Armatimonas sp.]|uniref:apolipoprotein N-acyltransferase n=1 Tax=Armatimonas sp. TaxID=1872638 RepID=UPI00374C9F49
MKPEPTRPRPSATLPLRRRGWGWICAPLSGLLLVLAFPNFNLWPLAWVALVPFYLALTRPAPRTHPPGPLPSTKEGGGRRGFSTLLGRGRVAKRGTSEAGWVLATHGFGLGFTIFLTGVYWISELNGTTPADKLFPWIGLAAIQGSFFAVFAALAGGALTRLPPLARPFAFAAGWVTFELIRTLGTLNFPWMILAVSQAHGGGLIWLQLVSVGGQWLLSFAIALVNGLLAEAWAAKSWKPAKLAGALFLGIGLSGFLPSRTQNDTELLWYKPERGVTVTALQGGRENMDGIPDYAPLTEQAAKNLSPSPSPGRSYLTGKGEQGGKALPSLPPPRGYPGTTARTQRVPGEGQGVGEVLIVWPEAAAGPLVGSEWRSKFLAELAIRTNADLLIGAGEAKPHTNTVWHIRPDGSTGGRYDKQVLVPGGEFFPLYEVLGPIYFRFGATPEWNHIPGNKPGVFSLADGTKVGTIICYESVLPWVARQEVQNGAELLVQPTSDSSFGRTAGPYQHLGIVITRAVENRRYIVRAAATGVSAIICPGGRVEASLDLGKTGALTGIIVPLTGRSLASRIGDLVAYLCAAGSVLALAYPLAPARRGKRESPVK